METRVQTSLGLVLMLWAAGLGAAGQFAKIAVPFPFLQAQYPGAGSEIGFLVSMISFLGIVLGLVAGLFVARIGARPLLIGALFFGAALSLWQSLLPGFGWMLLARLLEGLSHLIIVVAAPTLIAQYSAPQHRSAAMTLWSSFFGVAFAVTAWLGLPFVEAYGLGQLFLLHGVYMAAFGGLLLWRLPRTQGPRPDATPLNVSEILRQHVRIYRSPFEAAPALAWLTYTLTFVSLIAVLPSFVAPELRGTVSLLMPLAGLTVSLTLGMALLRVIPAVQAVILGFSLAIIATLALAAMPGTAWLCIALFGALGLVQGGSFAAIPQLNDTATTQAHANGAIAQMGNLGNTLGTPLLLSITVAFGFAGLIGFLLICFSAGIAVHLIQQQRRNAQSALACDG